MKTIAILTAILFSISLKSQITYKAFIEQTYVLVNEDWAKRDSAIGELRRIDLDAKMEKLTLTISPGLTTVYDIITNETNKETNLSQIYALDEKNFPILFEYDPEGTQGAIYYFLNAQTNNFMKAESLAIQALKLD